MKSVLMLVVLETIGYNTRSLVTVNCGKPWLVQGRAADLFQQSAAQAKQQCLAQINDYMHYMQQNPAYL